MFNSLPIMLFVLRLVAAPRGQGYRITLCELWEACQAAGVALPQTEPPAASTACEAREKFDDGALRRRRREILAHSPDGPPWKGHRILAVDGSKTTLPRELAPCGYRITTTAKEQVAQASRRLTAAPAGKTQASEKTPEAQ